MADFQHKFHELAPHPDYGNFLLQLADLYLRNGNDIILANNFEFYQHLFNTAGLQKIGEYIHARLLKYPDFRMLKYGMVFIIQTYLVSITSPKAEEPFNLADILASLIMQKNYTLNFMRAVKRCFTIKALEQMVSQKISSTPQNALFYKEFKARLESISQN